MQILSFMGTFFLPLLLILDIKQLVWFQILFYNCDHNKRQQQQFKISLRPSVMMGWAMRAKLMAKKSL